jgi:hypothetical protein
MKKICALILIGFFIISGLEAVALKDNVPSETQKQDKAFVLSEPLIEDEGQYVAITMDQATSSLFEVGKPVLPVVTHTFILPFGSKVEQVDVAFSHTREITVTKEVQPYEEPEWISLKTPYQKVQEPDRSIYEQKALYPTTEYSYRTAAGLDNDEHVLFLTVDCYPIRYSPQNNLLYWSETIKLTVYYQQPTQTVTFPDDYDLVIIAPEEYTTAIQPLIAHKENHNVKTLFQTTESIYQEYPGRDEPEKIKYFIKDAVENLGATYVLLIGSIYKLPIRASSIRLWGRWQEETLTDLYYADVLDAHDNFSSWDTNNNNIFGETDEDQLDLYPDVHIGRLACNDITEVETVVDKIIHYEDETYNQDWYHQMIYIGGNTFPSNPGNEGEEINEMVMDIMTDFTPSSVIWTSQGNFNRKTISEAINEGAGFLDYSGHGFEYGMGTYPPTGFFLKSYLIPYIQDLVNGYKLPIIFFDACLTAKLDFILQDFLDYKYYRIFDVLAKILNYNTSMQLPCFAWCFMKHEDGGAIATIGATRTAFGGVNSGAGKMSLEFFGNYHNSETLGQMMTKAQNGYITDVPDDEFTVEEFILLGDPSLTLGGYP